MAIAYSNYSYIADLVLSKKLEVRDVWFQWSVVLDIVRELHCLLEEFSEGNWVEKKIYACADLLYLHQVSAKWPILDLISRNVKNLIQAARKYKARLQKPPISRSPWLRLFRVEAVETLIDAARKFRARLFDKESISALVHPTSNIKKDRLSLSLARKPVAKNRPRVLYSLKESSKEWSTLAIHLSAKVTIVVEATHLQSAVWYEYSTRSGFDRFKIVDRNAKETIVSNYHVDDMDIGLEHPMNFANIFKNVTMLSLSNRFAAHFREALKTSAKNSSAQIQTALDRYGNMCTTVEPLCSGHHWD